MLLKILAFASSTLLLSPTVVIPVIFCWLYALPIKWQIKVIRRIHKIWCWIIFLALGVKLQYFVEKAEKIADPYVILANHRSFFDIAVIMRLFKCGFILKSSLMYTPFGWNAKYCGSISLDRSSTTSFLKVMKQCKKRIHQKINLCLFPEGTRNTKNELLPFKRGLLDFYYKQKIPALIIAYYGSDKVLPDKALLPRLGNKIVVYNCGYIKPETCKTSAEFKEQCYQKMQKGYLKAKEIWEQ